MKKAYKFIIKNKRDGMISYEITGPHTITRGHRRGTVKEVTAHYRKAMDRLNFVAEAAALKSYWGNAKP